MSTDQTVVHVTSHNLEQGLITVPQLTQLLVPEKLAHDRNRREICQAVVLPHPFSPIGILGLAVLLNRCWS